MKNTMVEIRLNIDVWIIPTLYIVALDCIFTIAVGSVLKISAECIYICTNAPKLPNSVNPITKLTSWLNSRCKMGPGHVQHILNHTHVKLLPKWAGNLFLPGLDVHCESGWAP